MKATATFNSCPLLSVLAAALLLSACADMNAGSRAASGAPAISRERIAEIVASPDRSAADRTNDIRRKPEDTLAFIGIRPGMVALDLSAGGGYTTELVARAVGPTGRVYGQSAPRNPASVPPAAPEGASAPATAPAPAPVSAPPAASLTSAQRLAVRAQNPNAGNIIAVTQ